MKPTERLLEAISKLFFAVTALALFLLAAGLVAVAVRDVWAALPEPGSLAQILRSIGLLTIAVAVITSSKLRAAPAALRRMTWPARSWSPVDTRA